MRLQASIMRSSSVRAAPLGFKESAIVAIHPRVVSTKRGDPCDPAPRSVCSWAA